MKLKHTFLFTLILLSVIIVTLDFKVEDVAATSGRIGWDEIGAVNHVVPSNWKWTYGCTAPENGTIYTILAYCGKYTAGSCPAQAFIWTNNGSAEGMPNAMLEKSAEVTLYNNFSWVVFTLDNPVTLVAGTRYHLGMQSGTADHVVRGESHSTVDDFWNTNSGEAYPAIPDNASWVWYGESVNRLSIYAIINNETASTSMTVDGDLYYHRSDTHTVNNLTAYQLQLTQTTSEINISETYSGNVEVDYGFRVWILHSTTTVTELTSGTPTAILYRVGNGSGILNNTWTPSRTPLNLGFDALRIYIYMRFTDTGSWSVKATFVSSRLLYTQVESETWCFNLWTNRTNNDTHTIGSFTFGSVTYNSRVVNVHFTDPTARELMMYNLQSGQLFSFFAFPYVNLIGVLFWGIIYFIMCGGLLMRYKSSTPVLLLLVLFGGAGGVGSILIAGVGLEIAWIFALISLAALLYRLVR